MTLYRLERGLVIQLDDQKYSLQRVIDREVVQFENIRTGQFREFKISQLVKKISERAISVIGNDEVRIQSNDLENEISKVEVFASSFKDKQYKRWREMVVYTTAVKKRNISRGQRSRIRLALIEIYPEAEKELGKHKIPSDSTVISWLKKFEISGGNFDSLISGNVFREKTPRKSSNLRQFIQSGLKKHYFVRNGLSISKTFRELKNQVDQLKNSNERLDSFSESTVRRIALETDPYTRDRIRLGASFAAQKWRHATGGIYATRVLQRVEIDHTLLDLYVIDDRRGIPLGRSTVTIIVDAYSSYILSIYVSFEGGSIGRVAKTIKIALVPKDDLLGSLTFDNPWYTPGLWEVLVVDNGLEFHSSYLKALCLLICSDLEFCPVRKPWFKPTVERTLGECCRILPMPGRVEKLKGLTKYVDPKITACITFSDLCVGLYKWVIDVHPLRVNERKLSRPLDLFLEGLESMPPPVYLDDLRSLDVLTGVEQRYRVSHTGIEIMSLTYRSPELRDMARQIAPSFPVTVRTNPDDIGSIWVQHPKELTWINVPATDSAYAAGKTMYQHRLIRDYARENLREVNAYEQYIRAEADLQGMFDVGARSGKKIKQIALAEGVRSTKMPSSKNTVIETLQEKRVITPQELSVKEDDIPDFQSFNLNTYR